MACVLTHVILYIVCSQTFDTNKVAVMNKGPKANLEILQLELKYIESAEDWAGRAQVTALLGSNKKSHNEFKCGASAWLKFAKAIGYENHELPPTPEMILQWSMLFRYVLCSMCLCRQRLHVFLGEREPSATTLGMLSYYVS